MSVRSEAYYAQIPEWILYHPDLSARSLQLYAVLDRYANTERHAHPSRKKLALRCRCAVKTVDRALEELVAADVVVVTPRVDESGDPTSNDYFVRKNDPSLGRDIDDATPGVKNVPTGSVKNVPLIQSQLEPEPSEPVSASFEDFWKAYPPRHGKKVEKKKAVAQWNKLDPADRDLASVAVHHYRAACEQQLTLAKDAFRWLRDRLFEDWQTPAQVEPKKSAGETGRSRLPEFRAGTSQVSCEHSTPICLACRRATLEKFKDRAAVGS